LLELFLCFVLLALKTFTNDSGDVSRVSLFFFAVMLGRFSSCRFYVFYQCFFISQESSEPLSAKPEIFDAQTIFSSGGTASFQFSSSNAVTELMRAERCGVAPNDSGRAVGIANSNPKGDGAQKEASVYGRVKRAMQSGVSAEGGD
jgi:hypothetical protein